MARKTVIIREAYPKQLLFTITIGGYYRRAGTLEYPRIGLSGRSTMDILGKQWEKGRVLLADGAWGTEFFKRGLMQGNPPDEWNLIHPEIVMEITREYLDAGAEVILTNTFGANRLRLDSHGLSGKSKEINRTGAKLTRDVVGKRAVVVGDIGPSGKLFTLGEVGSEELYAAFAEQAASLREGGADWIVVESMTDMEEMAIAVKAAHQATGLPVVASMTYNKTPKGFRTMMGNTPEACVERAQSAGASIIGANCGSGIEDYVPLAPVLRALTSLPLWIKANAGVPQIVDGKVVYPLSPEQYAAYIPMLIEAGVDAVGGCCGTDPSFIREIRAQISKHRRK
jgi:5-methyltetrahydrofolate--homocysteine methyltransferase